MGNKVKVGEEVKAWGWRDCERAMEFYAQAKAAEALAASELQADLAAAQRRHSGAIELAQRRALDQDGLIREFARIHRAEFKSREEGGDTRSYEHAGVAVGYRLDPPKVRIESEQEATVWLAKQFGEEYIRRNIEPNREAIRDLLSNDAEPLAEKFALHGITLQQKDRFFIEVKGGQ